MTQAPPTASTTKAWHIDHSALLPGDVLLEAGNTLFGGGVRAINGGDYSHPLLWLGNTDFIEARLSACFARSWLPRPMPAQASRWSPVLRR